MGLLWKPEATLADPMGSIFAKAAPRVFAKMAPTARQTFASAIMGLPWKPEANYVKPTVTTFAKAVQTAT
jgi:hypothetical protein